jgi:glycosyltransferase involved in cell wall biosynthesis
MKVTLLVPTLNEIDGMRVIMPQIQPGWVDQVLVLDGGSTDGTIEYAREHGYDVVIQEERGLINAYRQVRPHIKGDVLITFSPDGNSVTDRIPALLEKMREGYDMVIVSRYLPGATSDDDTFMTRVGNWVFTTLINVLFGGHYTDAMVIYRAYRTQLIDDLGLMKDEPYSVERRFRHMISWEPLLSMRAAKKKLKIGEIPGDEPARIGGEGKCMHYSWGAVYLLEMGQEFARRLVGR